jgi:thiosulfate/3-mercaptopyruvate sulfurtransferase
MEDVTLEELQRLVDRDASVLLDVRTPFEFEGTAGAHCDPRQGHIPGAVNLPLERILECRSANEVRRLVDLPEGAEIVAYCHSGSRSRFAAEVLQGAGYRARNYVGSWHEWSRAVPEPSG